jgi:hypothetical protein
MVSKSIFGGALEQQQQNNCKNESEKRWLQDQDQSNQHRKRRKVSQR